MEYRLCEYIKYIGRKPLFKQSINRRRYTFSPKNDFTVKVESANDLLWLLKRSHGKLVPVVPLAGIAETSTKSKPKKSIKKPRRK